MWLAECAVDTETLEVLAENGIVFTVLSPYQAQAVKTMGWGDWQDVTGGKIDTRCAYICNLPSGRSINLFFYDGTLSQKIAFAGLLNDGGNFARQLIDANPKPGSPVLTHVATDGESYGHHHRYGDMALAYCLETIDNSAEAQLTVYGEFLSFYPPESEVRIIENSSWSCAHGVERWRSDCSCGDGTPGYHHKWRRPLRVAMNDLRDKLADLFENAEMFLDCWTARDKYIDVILDRSKESVNIFLRKVTDHELTPDERVKALMLLEMQRNALLMFTSCGWFFDEISRIEPVQIMRYAARAIELAKMVFDVDLEPAYLKLLAEAPSNVPELQDGAKIYELRAKQGRVDRKQMAAYYGITSLLRDFKPEFSEGCWDMKGSVLKLEMGEGKSFSAGKVHVNSNITEVAGDYLFAVQHNGGTMILCGICETSDMNALTLDDVKDLQALFYNEDSENLLFQKFGYDQFTLNNIPANSRHRLITELLQQDVHTLENRVKDIVKNYDQLLEYLTLLGSKPPAIITMAAEFTLTSEIIDKLSEPAPDVSRIRRDFEFAGFWQVKPDEEQIRFAFSECVMRILAGQCMSGLDVSVLENLNDLISLFNEEFDWHMSLYDAQNLYYELLRQYGDTLALEPENLREALHKLGHSLKFSDELLAVLD